MTTFAEWMARAEQYVENARVLLGTDDREALVQCQQVAEYGLKASISVRSSRVPKDHGIARMGRELGVPKRFKSTLTYLETVYDRRYPNDLETPVRDPEGKIAEIEDLLSWIRKQHR